MPVSGVVQAHNIVPCRNHPPQGIKNQIKRWRQLLWEGEVWRQSN